MAQPSSETPQEVIDGVIDLCSKDRKALITCSLISRAWVNRSRKYLFSSLTLTSKNLSAWCAVVATQMQQQPPKSSPLSPSYAPPSPYVTSLQFASEISQAGSGNFEEALVRASTHFSAFVNLSSLTLFAVSVSFIAFMGAPLEACFGSLGKTVRKLKLDVCALDWMFLAFLKLFTHLEELELNENIWVDYKLIPWTSAPGNHPTLCGSFEITGFTDANIKILDSLSPARIKYHTITIGYNRSSTFSQFNTLFSRCKGHLKTLVFTNADSLVPARDGLALDLSPCEKLVQIRAGYDFATFASIIAILRTVSSRRFRKLTLLMTSHATEIKLEAWAELEEEISALAKRVGATDGNDTLEVVICSSSRTLKTQLSEIEEVFPLISRDACVSLRTEDLPPPSDS